MRFFVSSTSLITDVLPEHDEILSGDTLAIVNLNYRWRKLIVAILEGYFRQDLSDTSIDNQDLLSQLFEDFYNE